MFVYAAYLCNSMDIHRVTILSSDNDVAVIACYQICHSLRNCQEVWFITGFGENRRLIPLHTAYITLGASIFKVLPVFHCLTGCDPTGSFSGIGKRKAFKTLKAMGDQLPGLAVLGESPILDLNSECVVDVVKFVCRLYDFKGDEQNIDKLRYRLFCRKNISGDKLPPSLDALLLHISRTAYQSFIWQQAQTPVLNLPPPVENGTWKLSDDGKLLQVLMTKDPAPKQIAELVYMSLQIWLQKK